VYRQYTCTDHEAGITRGLQQQRTCSDLRSAPTDLERTSAYGQTGSGKTFTITGGPEKYEDRVSCCC